MQKQIILHLFAPGSGEHALHNYLHGNNVFLNSLGLCYPATMLDTFCGTPSHQLLQEYIYVANYSDDHSERIFCNKRIDNNITDLFSQNTLNKTIILSVRLTTVERIHMLFNWIKDIASIKQYDIKPIFSLCKQENSIEYHARYGLWYYDSSSYVDNFLKADLYNYNYLLDAIPVASKKYKVHTLKPSIVWHTGEPGAIDIDYLKAFFAACGCALPDVKATDLPYTELRAYHTLRFVALTLPLRNPALFRLLNLDPITYSNIYLRDKGADIKQALKRAEDEGAVSLAALTASDVRRKVQDVSKEGNDALALAHPELAPQIHSPAYYAEHVPSVEQMPLDAGTVDTLLDYFTAKQSAFLFERLRVVESFLNPEQTLILQRLEGIHTVRMGKATLKTSPLVSVLTLTKNHKQYIAENMDSVLAQKTRFPVEHIIVDDDSTDGTQDIIENYATKYPNIKPFFLRHRGLGENVQVLFRLAHTPFVALCDGDDYFTDMYKLQKQVDFLDAHPDYGLCFHPVYVKYEDGTNRYRFYPPLDEMPRGVREFYYLSDLIKKNLIQTNSVMYRWRFQDGLPEWFRPDLVPGDWYWHLLHAEKGKIGFINEVMAVYRRHKASLYYTTENFDTLIQHRLLHGMKELETYDVVNEHFERKYDRVFCGLANNVFSAFLEHQLDTDDGSYLTGALEKYPLFGAVFLKELKVFRVSRSKK